MQPGLFISKGATMSEILDNLLASSGSITNHEQIKNIVDIFYNTRLQEIKPAKSPSFFTYVFNQITKGFCLTCKEFERNRSIGFFIYLLHQARYNDFFKFEEKGKDIDFISFPITLSCALAKSLIYESSTVPAVETFLNIGFNAYLDAMNSYCSSDKTFQKELSIEMKRFMPGIEIVLPQKTDLNTTLKDVFKEALKVASRPYSPGTQPLSNYFNTVMNASTFISDLLVELPYIAFHLEYAYQDDDYL